MHGEEMQTELRLPPREQKGGAGILDRGRAVGAAQKDPAAMGRAVLPKSDVAAVELLLCVCGRAYGRRKTGRICLLLSALPKTRETIKQNMRRLQSGQRTGR